jgi:hypothetical protein
VSSSGGIISGLLRVPFSVFSFLCYIMMVDLKLLEETRGCLVGVVKV